MSKIEKSIGATELSEPLGPPQHAHDSEEAEGPSQKAVPFQPLLNVSS